MLPLRALGLPGKLLERRTWAVRGLRPGSTGRGGRGPGAGGQGSGVGQGGGNRPDRGDGFVEKGRGVLPALRGEGGRRKILWRLRQGIARQNRMCEVPCKIGRRSEILRRMRAEN